MPSIKPALIKADVGDSFLVQKIALVLLMHLCICFITIGQFTPSASARESNWNES